MTVSDGTDTATDTFAVTVTAANDPPTISDVADQTVAEDTATAALPFTVGDVETAAASLVVTGSSSNLALVPDANIVLGGSGAARTVTVTPAANQSGTATITLTVSDGTDTVTDTFVVTVTAQNDPPTISDVADQAVAEDTATSALAVTVGDIETPAASLLVTATSSDQTLVPNANLVIGGSGAARTVTVTPAANQSGTATITVTVSDGTTTTSDTFVLTVTAANDPPTISDVADQTTAEDTATGALAVTVGDVETPAASLTVTATSSNQTLVPDGNLVLGGSGASRTITATPAANQSGTATITVTVSDGTDTVTDTFVVTVTAQNDPPTISDVADQAVAEDTATAALAVTVGDVETAAASLTVTATSSDQTLVPNANVVLGGSGAARTVTVTPAANQSGTATITLTVSDGTTTASDTFVLTVTAVNDPPTISDAADQTVAEDTATGALAVTVGDVETPAASLLVTATSSDQTLVPNANVVIGGSGANRTVTVTPAANQSGSATITLTVSDGTDTATDTFVVTVTAQNDPPTISDVADQTTTEDTATGSLAVTVGDVETPAGSLTVTATSSNQALVPDANVVIGGSGAARTVTVTPAANQSGTATITVTVSDGTTTTSDTFVLTVTAANDPPTISDVADQTVAEDTATGALAVTVGDVETPPGSLTVTGSSSNQALVPDANVVIGGSGANRTVTVTPAANQSGTAIITVTVSDGTDTATDAFVVTVTAQNDPPTISNVADQRTPTGTPTGAIAFTVGDNETGAGSLTVTATSSNQTLAPDASIVLGGSGTARTAGIAPAAGQSGTTTITLTVSDGAASAQVTFLLTVGGIVVSPVSGLTTTEAGGTATFTLVLTSQPTADVTIGVHSSDTTEGTVAPASITFTSTDWATPQTLTVTGADDSEVDGDQVFSIVTDAATSGDAAYAGQNASDVSLTNTDDDTAGVTVTPAAGLVVSESGTTATFTVALRSQPTADVTVGLSSSDTSEATVAPASVTFTALTWNTPQTVTATGVDDARADGNQALTVLTAPAASADPAYAGVNPADVGLTNTDDDVAGVTVTPTAGLVTSEAGGTAAFTVVLNTEPASDVTIGVSSSAPGEGTVSPSSVTFTPANWNAPQTVAVTGVNDPAVDGPQAYAVVTAAAVSSDPAYADLDAADAAVTNTDDDSAGVSVTPTAGLVTTESGGSASFTIVLTSRPIGDVTIDLSSSDATEGTVSPASVTFAPANWNAPQTVTVTGVDDPAVDGPQTYTVVTATAVSSDPAYDGVDAADVGTTNTDDDLAGFVVRPLMGLATTEVGGTAAFTIVLTSQPTADVTIDLSSSDPTEGTVSPVSVTFTPTTWNQPRMVTVIGVDDAEVDGLVGYAVLTAAATSPDPLYAGVDAADVSVGNLDNDVAGIDVSPATGLTTTEAGGKATFTVVLTSQPTGDVTIGLSSSDTTEGTVAPASVTFTAATWNSPQTVTVTGADDHVADGPVPYRIVTAAAIRYGLCLRGPQRRRCRAREHRRRHRGHRGDADHRAGDFGGWRDGELHGGADQPADGRRANRPQLERHDGGHGRTRGADVHERDLERAADGDGDRR